MFRKETASFPAEGTPEEAAARLRSAMQQTWSLSIRRGIVGRVTVARVALRRRLPPLTSNSFAPQFTGRFTVVDGRTVLAGSFAPPGHVVAFAYFWFAAMLILFPITMAVTAIREYEFALSTVVWLFFLLAGLVFAAVGYAIIRFSQWLARDDVPFISQMIRETLEAGSNAR